MRCQSSLGVPFRAFQDRSTRGATVGLHAHDAAQLVFAATGTLQVYTQSGRWFVPPQLAVWVPGRMEHRVDVLSDVELRMIYWDPAAVRAWAPVGSLGRAFALRVTPLLRAVILAAFAMDAEGEKAELAMRLILHEVAEAPDAPTFLPLPVSAVGRRVAELALADPQGRLDLGELASRAASSVRSVSRLFPVETGLSFKAWRQRARIVSAIDRLSRGVPVMRVAADSGFASTAAFSFAFRQVTRLTPTAFLRESGTG